MNEWMKQPYAYLSNPGHIRSTDKRRCIVVDIQYNQNKTPCRLVMQTSTFIMVTFLLANVNVD